MPNPAPIRGPLTWALAIAIALGLLALLAAIFHLGPFDREPLSRGALIAAGDEICLEAHQAFADLQAKAPQTPAQAAELTDRLVGIASDEADRIGALNGPPEFDDEIDRYLEARRRGIDALRDGHEAAADEDADAYQAAQAALDASQRERRRLARGIGFAECSRPLSR